MSKFDHSRRNALKITAVLAATPVVYQIASAQELLGASAADAFGKNIADGVYETAAHWGVLKITVKDGKIVSSVAAAKPTSNIPNSLQGNTADMVYKSRVKHTYVRKSYLANPDNPKPELRGSEEFVKVPYEEAIKLVARELKKTRAKKGNDSIFAGSYGWKSAGNVHNARTLLHRFMNMGGGFTSHLGDYSTGAAQVIMPHVVGSIEVYEQQTSWPVVLDNSKVVVWWGANPLGTLKLSWASDDGLAFGYIEKLKKSNIKVIIIDPCETDTTKYFNNATHIKPVPNTDVAMMLAMANYLYKTKKYDKKFIETYTFGFDKFLPYLLGKEDGIDKTPKWAEKICGISAKTIEELANTFHSNRTMVMAGWGMQRAHHGEQPHWMITTLCAMLGQIGLPGGGFGYSYHYAGGGNPTCKGGVVGGITPGALGIWDKDGNFLGLKSDKNIPDDAKSSWLKKAGNISFPVARITEAILNPGKVIDHNGSKIKYPDIDFIYWVGGNPIVHQQETNLNLKAWRKPRTVVVNGIYWTPTTRMADIIFPTTSEYERNDITMVGDYSNYGIAPIKQVAPKQNDAKNDYEIFCDLCIAYGGKKLLNAYNEGKKGEMDWIKELYNKAYESTKKIPDLATSMKPFEEFWKENKTIYFAPTPESEGYVRYASFREDPILNALGTPSGLIEIYSQTIEKMHYDDCKPHPTWFEPIEWLGMKNKPAEFHLLSPHPEDRLHSQQNQTSLRDKYAVAGHEPIYINKKDAQKKDIKDGDVVRVFNKRGQILCGAVLQNNMREGVVKVFQGAWYNPQNPSQKNTICKNGSANVLTIDIPTSKLANGNIAHTCLVNIEKYKGENPKVTVFDQPKGA